MKIYFFILCLSFLYPMATSRLAVSADFPSHFTHTIENKSDGLEVLDKKYDTDVGFDIGYEHKVLESNDLYLFVGGEFMIGRNSDLNTTFHSIYIKPALRILEKSIIFSKIGISMLNVTQSSFPLDKGTILSLGFEYEINKKLSMAFVGNLHDMFDEEKSNPAVPNPFPVGPPLINVPDTEHDLRYNRIGITFFYGFNTSK